MLWSHISEYLHHIMEAAHENRICTRSTVSDAEVLSRWRNAQHGAISDIIASNVTGWKTFSETHRRFLYPSQDIIRLNYPDSCFCCSARCFFRLQWSNHDHLANHPRTTQENQGRISTYSFYHMLDRQSPSPIPSVKGFFTSCELLWLVSTELSVG